ncbi:hypothetical protein D3C83_189890 [compost metagenome]
MQRIGVLKLIDDAVAKTRAQLDEQLRRLRVSADVEAFLEPGDHVVEADQAALLLVGAQAFLK